MASKSDILKRISAYKKGKPTWQDKNRLKTWKDAKQGSREREHGYNRAVRNMQRSAQQGQAFNKVDAQIAESYIKETPQQLLDKSKTFIDMMTWFGGGAAVKGVTKTASLLTKGFAKPLTAAAKAAKKASETAVKKAAAPTTRVAKEVVKKAVVPVRRAAQRVAGKLSGSTAAKAAAKKALKTAQRKAQRARISARNKVLGDIAKGGEHTKGLAKTADRAGRTAYNKVIRQHGKTAKATTAARKIKNLKSFGAGFGLASIPLGVVAYQALKDDKKPTVKAQRTRGQRVAAELKRLREEAKDKAAAEKKAITESRAGRPGGIGAGRKSEREVENILRDLAHQDPTGKYYPSKGTRRALKPWEGGVRYINLPEWLGGGRIKVDSSPDVFKEYETSGDKHGGQIKRSMKKPETKPRKTKAKTRKHAAIGSKPKGVGVATHGYGKAMKIKIV